MMVIATNMDVISSSMGDPEAEGALMGRLGIIKAPPREVQNLAQQTSAKVDKQDFVSFAFRTYLSYIEQRCSGG